jgi:hypothetical protein
MVGARGSRIGGDKGKQECGEARGKQECGEGKGKQECGGGKGKRQCGEDHTQDAGRINPVLKYTVQVL